MTTLRKILHVEDDADIRDLVKLCLELTGDIEIMGCRSGFEALNLIESFNPDLLLIDYMMPEMDGPSFVKHAREQGLIGTTAIVFMTGKSIGEELDQIPGAKLAGVIEKPFDPATLSNCLHSIFKRWHSTP